jgi:predicted RND superfamily exporter protein
MAKLILHIYDYFESHRKTFFTVFIGLFIITGFFAIKIKPEEDISRILPKDRQSEKLNEILHNSRFADRLVLMISMEDSNQVSRKSLLLMLIPFLQ